MFRKLAFVIRDYFGFSRAETRGFLLLMVCLSLAFAVNLYIEQSAFLAYEQKDADLLILDSLMQKIAASEQKDLTVETKPNIKKLLFKFDPNQATYEELMRLGIKEKLSSRIVNFRNKGGRFYKNEDILKIYDFPPSLYEEILPYIDIPSSAAKKKTFTKYDQEAAPRSVYKKEWISPEKELVSFDINTVDSLQISALKGIGAVLSARIVKYREQLGGFHSKEQLKEIYHISDQALHSLEQYAYIDKSFVPQKIKINGVDLKTLLKHPYIDYALAKAIMNHRRIYGNFSSAEELKEVYQMKEELFVKLLPYVVI